MESERTLDIINKERANLAKLSYLLEKGGNLVLRSTFDSIYPPICLKERLAATHVHCRLMQLQEQGTVTEKQWFLLYPKSKKLTTVSERYDTKLLFTLLEFVCHLSPPYPQGWSAPPLFLDSSLSAEIVRLKLQFVSVANMEAIPTDEYTKCRRQTEELFQRLGREDVTSLNQRLDSEVLTQEQERHHIESLKTAWTTEVNGVIQRQIRLAAQKEKQNQSRKKGQQNNGLSPEDLAVLHKTYKLFTDNIQVVDIMDKLIQGQILKLTDRQDIMSQAKNPDRMRCLLDKIQVSVKSNALKLLIEAIKFKHPKMHDNIMQIRKNIYLHGIQNNFDVVKYLQECLSQTYRTELTRCTPFPWNEGHQIHIMDMYTSLDVVDVHGTKVPLGDMLPPLKSQGPGTLVLLEGQACSGMTSLCSMLTYHWSHQKNYFSSQYTFVILLDLEETTESLVDVIFKQLLPSNFKLTREELASTLETYARETLFILDGCTEGAYHEDVRQMLQRTKLRKSSILVTDRLPSTLKKYKPDVKYYNLGLRGHHVHKCFKTFINISHSNQDDFEDLLTAVDDGHLSIKPYLANPITCAMIFACYQNKVMTDITKVTTLSQITERYIIALIALYYQQQRLPFKEKDLSEEMVSTISKLEELAMLSLSQRNGYISPENLEDLEELPLVFKLGFLRQAGETLAWKFHCKLLRDQLAARYLARANVEDLTADLNQNMWIIQKHGQMIAFLAKILSTTPEDGRFQMLMAEIQNAQLYDVHKENVDMNSKSSTASTVETSTKHTSGYGQIQEYKTGLACLVECSGREEAQSLILEDTKYSFIIHEKGLVAEDPIRGLSCILQGGSCCLTELYITFTPVHNYQQNCFGQLAKSISQNKTLRKLKIFWFSLEMVAKFLAECLAENTTLREIKLDNSYSKSQKPITATTWAHLQKACQRMSHIDTLLFVKCNVAAIVGHVITYFSLTIHHIDFYGCCLNLFCANQIAEKLENSQCIQSLDLTKATLECSDIIAMIQGMKVSSSLKKLNLTTAKFDIASVDALSEYLRVTKSLQELDLSRCELSTNMRKQLSNAMTQSQHLTRLIMDGTVTTKQGKRGKLHVHETEEKPYNMYKYSSQI